MAEKEQVEVRRVAAEGVPSALLVAGRVTILGAQEQLSALAGRIYGDVVRGVDLDAMLYRYDLRVSDEYADLASDFECNIVAPLPGVLTGPAELLVASAEPERLGLAAVALIEEIERAARTDFETVIGLFALGAREAYEEAVQELMCRPRAISFRGHGSSGMLGKVGEEKISDREIREAYDSLPDRYSELYERRNPQAARVVRRSLEMMDLRGLVALLVEAAKTDRRLLQKLQQAKRKMASRFHLRVKQWSRDQKPIFKDQYRFCLYLADDDGREQPVKFRSNPSYCIYMMYVVDRVSRGDDATNLDIEENQAEFRRLYRSLFNEPLERIDSLCEEMLRRPTREKGITRKGRYDDYLKDINDTMDLLVGPPESISLKVGHGQFLEIPPRQIEIDKNLPKFDFV